MISKALMQDVMSEDVIKRLFEPSHTPVYNEAERATQDITATAECIRIKMAQHEAIAKFDDILERLNQVQDSLDDLLGYLVGLNQK